MNISVWVGKLVQKLWWLAAMLLVLSAVVLSAFRFALPYLNEFRDDISLLVTQTYDLPLTFGEIQASWQGQGPSLTLSEISLLHEQTQSPVQLSITAIHIEIDFWRSVLDGELVADNFTLDGVRADVDLKQFKGNQQTSTDGQMMDVLTSLFLKHFKRFEVMKSELTLRNHQQVERVIDIEQLAWLNKGSHHQGVGEFSIRGLDSHGLKFIINLDKNSGSGFDGQFYVKSRGLNLAALLEDYSADNVNHLRSQAPFEAWLSIDNSRASELFAQIEPGYIKWLENGDERQLAFTDGQLQADFFPNHSRWHLSSLKFADQDYNVSEISLDALFRQNKGLQLATSDINLKAVAQLTHLFAIPEDLKQLSTGMQTYSRLQHLSLDYPFNADWRVHARLADIGWAPAGDIPGIADWHVELAANPNGLTSLWRTERSQLHLPTLYDKAFDISHAEFNLDVAWQENWSVDVNKLTMSLPQIDMRADVKLYPDEDQQLTMSLFAETTSTSAKEIEPFLPRLAMGQEVYNYIIDAVKGGKVQGRALWQGTFADFPYQGQQGLFNAELAINNAAFKFQPDWPTATALDLQLSFINQGLYFYSTQGHLLDADLVKLTAGIPDLVSDNAYLDLQADIAATGAAARDVMNNSMLQDTVGAALDKIQIQGDISAELALHVPLVSSDDELVVKGKVHFDDNQILIAGPEFNLQQVNGELAFNMDELSATNLNFIWGHAPFNTDITASSQPEGYQVNLDLSSDWIPESLLRAYAMPYIASVAQGQIDWQGLLQLTIPKQGFRYEFSADFDLTDVALSLPAPYQKQAGQAETLTLTANGDEDKTRVHAHMDLLSFDAIMPHDQGKFTRAYLVLGEEQLGVPGQGFNIAVHLNEIILDDYIGFVNGLLDDISLMSIGSEGSAILDKPKRIRGDIDKLTLGPLIWRDSYFDMQSIDTLWMADVNAREFRGQLQINEDWLGKGIDVKAEYFNVTRKKADDTTEDDPAAAHALAKSIFEHMPPLTFECLRCEWQNSPIGQLDIWLSRDEDKIVFNELALKQGTNTINATGLWHFSEGKNQTIIQGTLDSKDIGHWIREHEYNSPVRDSGMEMAFQLSWFDSPYLLETETLSGSLDWQLDEGYFTEVSDQGARIFSLLSMDSLVRKLRLDFRDVFSKGLFFNDMSGTMSIANGIAKTQDTHMNGVAGNMDITGRANLNDNSIDYTISFAPKVTSSLPILVAWMVNPVTGVAALAIDKVLEKAEVISKIEFKVDGTFDEPQIHEVSRSSREVQLSNQDKPTPLPKQPEPEKTPPLSTPPSSLQQPDSDALSLPGAA